MAGVRALQSNAPLPLKARKFQPRLLNFYYFKYSFFNSQVKCTNLQLKKFHKGKLDSYHILSNIVSTFFKDNSDAILRQYTWKVAEKCIKFNFVLRCRERLIKVRTILICSLYAIKYRKNALFHLFVAPLSTGPKPLSNDAPNSSSIMMPNGYLSSGSVLMPPYPSPSGSTSPWQHQMLPAHELVYSHPGGPHDLDSNECKLPYSELGNELKIGCSCMLASHSRRLLFKSAD